MRKCWLVRYGDSRFANSAFFELAHFAWDSLSSNQSEQEEEGADAPHVFDDVIAEL
jgi:hypothetical protein